MYLRCVALGGNRTKRSWPSQSSRLSAQGRPNGASADSSLVVFSDYFRFAFILKETGPINLLIFKVLILAGLFSGRKRYSAASMGKASRLG